MRYPGETYLHTYAEITDWIAKRFIYILSILFRISEKYMLVRSSIHLYILLNAHNIEFKRVEVNIQYHYLLDD